MKTLYAPDSFSALLFPGHFQVPGSTQHFLEQTSASTSTGDQDTSRGIQEAGGGRQIASGVEGEKDRRQAVCARWRMQELVSQVYACGSTLSVCVKGEDFNTLSFKLFSPCLIISKKKIKSCSC